MHQLIRENSLGPRDTAERLDTTIDAVRYLLECHPAPRQPRMRTAAATRAALSRTELIDLYHRQQRSLREIATSVGVCRQTITRLARDYGIDLRAIAPPRIVIDRDWLYQQYVGHRRILSDLAREAGMSPTNMARWAKTHNIPLRARGGASHRINLQATDRARGAPAILQPALESASGWQRLQRFAAASGFPTITAATHKLGTCQGVLTTQIKRLENELGDQLLTRAERGRPMSLTPLGARVAAAVQQLQQRP